jgi:hypothetical protein
LNELSIRQQFFFVRFDEVFSRLPEAPVLRAGVSFFSHTTPAPISWPYSNFDFTLISVALSMVMTGSRSSEPGIAPLHLQDKLDKLW